MDCGSHKCAVNVQTMGCTGSRKCAPGIVDTTIPRVCVQGKWAAMYGEQPLQGSKKCDGE